MDFLVAGLGFGALLIIAGYAVREVGVYLFAPTRVRKQFPENPHLADAWRRMIRSASNAAMIGGGVMWLLALLAVAIDLSDGSGAIAMASAATIVSLVGAGVIAVAWRQMHAPALELADAQPTTKIELPSPSPSQQPAAAADDEVFDEWRPRVIGRASSTIAGDMPAWGATYVVDDEPAAAEPPAPIEPEAEPVSVEATDAIEARPTDELVEPVVVTAEPEAPEVEPVAASDVESHQNEVAEMSEAASAETYEEPPESVAAVEASDASEAEADREEVLVEETLIPEAAEPVETPVAPSEVELAAPVDDLVISEQPAPEPRPADSQAPAAPKRFKSSLLADIDESGADETNATFKSSLLADLSSVRLPDDVPRFHPTTLIDPPAAEKSDEKAKPNGSTNRR